MHNNLGTWTGRDPLVDEDGAYVNTVAERARVAQVAAPYVQFDPELIAMLGLEAS